MVIFNKLFNPIIALLIAGFFFISGADPASAKMDPYTDGQIAVDLCSKLILENKDGFSVLASRGYRVKKKEKSNRIRQWGRKCHDVRGSGNTHCEI